MTVRPLRVYLDSDDYSKLSNPKGQTPELVQIREQLEQWALTGEVEFWYSGAHLSEMAPLESQYTPAAAARADLLVKLCDRRALVSLDRLMLEELTCIANGNGPPRNIYSKSGDWFPEMPDLISPVKWIDTIKTMRAEGELNGLNRKQRRALERKFSKHQQPNQQTKEYFAIQQKSFSLDEITQMYPMREEDARVLSRYVTGQASAKEAESAFLESLRDPRWMMRWFAAHTGKLSSISDLLRAPAKTLTASMENMAKIATVAIEKVTEYRNAARGLGLSPDGVPVIDLTAWRQKEDEILVNVVTRGLKEKLGHISEPLAASVIDANAPGVASGVRSMLESTWNSVGKQARKLKESDFSDAVHAMYAPYVDVYRTDSYMAPIVTRIVERYGTTVAPKLSLLIPCIENRLTMREQD